MRLMLQVNGFLVEPDSAESFFAGLFSMLSVMVNQAEKLVRSRG